MALDLPKIAGGVEDFLARERARTSSYYRELPPAPDLAGVVACGWIRVVRRTPGAAAQFPVVPDGCADILAWDDSAPFIVGPDTQTRWLSMPDGLVITGLRLRPGVLRAALGCNAGEILDSSAALADITGSARPLQRALESAGTLESRLASLQAWVRAHVSVSSGDRAVIAACAALARDREANISQVAAAVGWNVRRMHREFIAACGYSPKYMQRILRVHRTVQMAHRSAALRLVELAAHAGFADQAHMSRDFRSITGMTPSAYLAQAEPGLGSWLAEDWQASDSFKTVPAIRP